MLNLGRVVSDFFGVDLEDLLHGYEDAPCLLDKSLNRGSVGVDSLTLKSDLVAGGTLLAESGRYMGGEEGGILKPGSATGYTHQDHHSKKVVYSPLIL